MRHPFSSSAKRSFALLIGVGLLAATTSFLHGLTLALVVGLSGLAVGALAVIGWLRDERPADAGRRRFLAISGLGGLALVVGGTALGRTLRRLTRPDPAPQIEAMGHDLGAEALTYLKRGHFPGHSGELQLVVWPFSSSNYSFESLSLAPQDPRTSHAAVWPYLERVPILVHAPGIVQPGTRDERVSLADLAPTAAKLMGFDFQANDGAPLPGVPAPRTPPKVIVTFVIDGGGWNVLRHWSPETGNPASTWQHLRALMSESLMFRNAVMGSFPSVTACAHATIGTGAYPWHHGISGHNVRLGRDVVKTYGTPGRAEPSLYLKTPTLAEAWAEHTNRQAWIGEIGYQIWHLGMIGTGGGTSMGRPPVAIYWDDADAGKWAPQNPASFRMPDGIEPREALSAKVHSYFPPDQAAAVDRSGVKVCCSPPIVEYLGDAIVTALEREPIGQGGATDLLYVNFKSPDYTGHVVNMLHPDEQTVLAEVDRQLARVTSILDQRFGGAYALIVAADHGQCPLPNAVGGVRLDPIQLGDDINAEFGTSIYKLIDYIAPSEVFLNQRALSDAGLTLADIAAFLRYYRYRDNIGPYIKRDAIEWSHLDEREFAGVVPASFLEALDVSSAPRYGSGVFDRIPQVEPGMPPITW